MNPLWPDRRLVRDGRNAGRDEAQGVVRGRSLPEHGLAVPPDVADALIGEGHVGHGVGDGLNCASSCVGACALGLIP